MNTFTKSYELWKLWFINSINKNALPKIKEKLTVTLDACTIQSVFIFTVQPENQPNKCNIISELYDTSIYYCVLLLYICKPHRFILFDLHWTKLCKLCRSPATIAYTSLYFTYTLVFWTFSISMETEMKKLHTAEKRK